MRLQSLVIFGESRDVDWSAGIPLAFGSAVGAYAATRLAARDWAKVWVYRFLVLIVLLSIIHALTVNTGKFFPV